MPIRKYTPAEIQSVVLQARKLLSKGENLRPAIEQIESPMKIASREIYIRRDYECMKEYRRHHWKTRTENSIRFLTFTEQVQLRTEELQQVTELSYV